jgi:hypothetical protein
LRGGDEPAGLLETYVLGAGLQYTRRQQYSSSTTHTGGGVQYTGSLQQYSSSTRVGLVTWQGAASSGTGVPPKAVQ